LGVEEFQRALQAAFNFPLRPFVLPFLRAGIPAMQREVAALARIAKMVRVFILAAVLFACPSRQTECRELSNFPAHARLSNLVLEESRARAVTGGFLRRHSVPAMRPKLPFSPCREWFLRS
jgi:hypothetical protein